MLPRLPRTLAALALLAWLAGPAAAGEPIYRVSGHIAGGAARTIATADLARIGFTELTTRVYSFGEAEHRVKGVLMRDFLSYVGASGQSVTVTALDGYVIAIPVTDFTSYDVVLATEIDGKPLSVRDRGPAWIIYPVSAHPELDDTVYESRSVWQVKLIEVD